VFTTTYICHILDIPYLLPFCLFNDADFRLYFSLGRQLHVLSINT